MIVKYPKVAESFGNGNGSGGSNFTRRKRLNCMDGIKGSIIKPKLCYEL